MTPRRLVYLGTSEFAAAILRALVDAGHDVALVVTRPDAPKGRGRKLTPPPVAETARELGLETVQPEDVNGEEARAQIAAAQPGAVIVCAYGALIKEPLLSDFELLNVHPSLLPKWRGAAPVERPIMAGDAQTGVSIMRVEAGLDSGPVYAQEATPIEPADTYGSLVARLEEISARLLLDVLERGPEPVAQDDEQATYADKITAADRTLDLARPAAENERIVRALAPHIGARIELADGSFLGVLEARVSEDGAFELVRVQPAGGKPMAYADYRRGRPEGEPPPVPEAPAAAAEVPALAPAAPGGHHKAGMAALTLGALGVVFGDIGTSPLYAMKEAFSGAHELAPDESSVYGVLSLIFWAITIIVTIKYVAFIMRADNGGEGGIMALIALVQELPIGRASSKLALVALGIFGAALFYGDGMITPAISVLSAVEGLEVVEPDLADYVIPITVTVLTTLFVIQRFGTGLVGRLFGPVMILWFSALGIFGLLEVVQSPEILRALSPHYGVAFFLDHGSVAFLALASVVLAVTGAEALYADMGHFGRPPIRRAWFLAVLPALVLNYLGQGALLLAEPSATDSPFFRLVPDGLLIPMVLLATAAAVIASQAVISGAFSVTRQAVQLGFLPLLTIKHTSDREIGQIYVPAVNWALLIAIIALVVGFGSSSALASAYGIAVTGTLAIDTILFFVVVRLLWRKPLWMVAAGVAGFLFVDLAFFAANLTKVIDGGWVPLVIGAVIFGLLMTWRRGRDIVTANRKEEEGPLQDFVLELQSRPDPPVRVPGTAVFLTADEGNTPLALRYNVEHNHVLHETVIVFTVRTAPVPHVPDAERIVIDDLLIPDDGIALVTATFGFQDDADVPAALRLAQGKGLPCDIDRASYFLSRITVAPTRERTMARWRKQIFVGMTRNAAGRSGYFHLPEEQVVSFGSQIGV